MSKQLKMKWFVCIKFILNSPLHQLTDPYGAVPHLYSLCSHRGGDVGMNFELVIRVEL